MHEADTNIEKDRVKKLKESNESDKNKTNNINSAIKKHQASSKQIHSGKSYYPKTSLNIERVRKINRINKSHKDILIELLNVICEKELTSIQTYFESNSNTSATRDIIKDNILNFLTDMPHLVDDNCPNDSQFFPELSRIENNNIKSLSSIKESLEKQSYLLDKYESDINKFGNDFQLWFQPILMNKLYDLVEVLFIYLIDIFR